MKLSITALLCALSFQLFATVKLPKIFGANMVLQREQAISIWGWADPKEKISIRFHGQLKSSVADRSGKWKILLDKESAGGPYTLTINGKNTITLENILVGDVWLCAGQSNMDWKVRDCNHADAEIQEANFPEIRHFKVPNTISGKKESDFKTGDWRICSPETAGSFSAVAFFFARNVWKETHIPIGLINASWGGTHIETWISREAFEESDEYREMIASMPRINIDSLYKQKALQSNEQIKKIQGEIPSDEAIKHWKDLSFDDQPWRDIAIPQSWEKTIGNVDGVIWFRKEVLLSNVSGLEGQLDLGSIDDVDNTFVNGVSIGSSDDFSIKRKYKIPKGVLRDGKNCIVIRVEDTGGAGGISGSAEELSLRAGDQTLPLAGTWKFQIERISAPISLWANSYPTLLFNAMINPLIPYTIKGALWYQGESNNFRAYQYGKALPLLIADWRSHWKEGNFPFYYVQLANYNANNGTSATGSTWAELRESQTKTLSVPNTGMAVTTDIGDPRDVHPRNKQDIGKRLAAIALHNLYGKEIVYGGPIFQTMKINGQKANLYFTNTGTGFLVKDIYGYIKGFEIAGSDKIFHYAKAYIENDHITVFADAVTDPVAVRYGWSDETTDLNLFNNEGFPAVPFRTDQWKGITTEAKYSIGQ